METLRSLMPVGEKLEIVTRDEIGIDTLAERLLEEVAANGAVLKMPDAVSAYATKYRLRSGRSDIELLAGIEGHRRL